MVTTPIEAHVRKAAGVALVDLAGDINAMAEPALSQAYHEAGNLGVERIVLNFTQVGYINSTGIALIVGLLATARKEGRSLAAFGLSDHYREIFEITRLADFLTIFPDEAAAMAGEKPHATSSGEEQ